MLTLFQQWILSVGQASRTLSGGSAYGSQLEDLALAAASRAFGAGGDPLNPAWTDLVETVNALLTFRSHFSPLDDTVARAALHLFVYENADLMTPEEQRAS